MIWGRGCKSTNAFARTESTPKLTSSHSPSLNSWWLKGNARWGGTTSGCQWTRQHIGTAQHQQHTPHLKSPPPPPMGEALSQAETRHCAEAGPLWSAGALLVCISSHFMLYEHQTAAVNVFWGSKTLSSTFGHLWTITPSSSWTYAHCAYGAYVRWILFNGHNNSPPKFPCWKPPCSLIYMSCRHFTLYGHQTESFCVLGLRWCPKTSFRMKSDLLLVKEETRSG